MARFTETIDGVVNLEHVVSIESLPNARMKLILSNGVEVVIPSWKDFSSDDLGGRLHRALQPVLDTHPTILPAVPGTMAAIIHIYVSTDEAETYKEYVTETTLVPVIGWRVYDIHSEPILIGQFNNWVRSPESMGVEIVRIYVKTPDSAWCETQDDDVAETIKEAEKQTRERDAGRRNRPVAYRL